MMNKVHLLVLIYGFLLVAGCAEKGEAADDACGPLGHASDGECHCDNGYEWNGSECSPLQDGGNTQLECGVYGHEHDGHCHCDPGYLFNGVSCVLPDDIATNCESAISPHVACRCPVFGNCPCEQGEIETIGPDAFCVPELDE